MKKRKKERKEKKERGERTSQEARFSVATAFVGSTDAGAQCIVSVFGWWDARCWARCSISKFQKRFFLTWEGGDASANIEIRAFPKTWSCKDSIGSATLLEPKGFLGSGVLPTKSKPAHCELLGFSKGGPEARKPSAGGPNCNSELLHSKGNGVQNPKRR